MGEEVDCSEVSCCADQVFAVYRYFGGFGFEGVDLVGDTVAVY